MTSTIRVLGIVGSLRQESFNGKLLREAVRRAPEGMTIELGDVLRIPLFDEDLLGSIPGEVIALHQAVHAADAVIIATPEYSFGVPGVLKNALDWCTTPPPASGPFLGKPVMVMGASLSPIGNTLQAQSQLRITLAILGAQVMPYPPIGFGMAHEKFDGDTLTDEGLGGMLSMALAGFERHARRLIG